MRENNKRSKTSIIFNIICIVICIFLVPVLLINLIFIVQGLIDKTKVPSIFGYSALVVETNSMVPTFKGGDLIIISKCDTDLLQKDDVISYYEPTVSDHSVVVSHKIVGIINNEDGSRSFRTQGEANNVPDSTVLADSEIVGKYLFKIENVGSFVMFMSSTNGVLLFIVLPLVLIFGIDYVVRFLEQKKKK